MAGSTVIIDDIDETAPPEPIIPLPPEVEELWSSRAREQRHASPRCCEHADVSTLI